MSMAQFEKRTKATTVHEYVLPNPCNWVEVGKALSYARQEYEAANSRTNTSDDSIWITHADDEIIIYWEEN